MASRPSAAATEDEGWSRTCPHCLHCYPRTAEHFYRRGDGFDNYCRSCRSSINAAYKTARRQGLPFSIARHAQASDQPTYAPSSPTVWRPYPPTWRTP